MERDDIDLVISGVYIDAFTAAYDDQYQLATENKLESVNPLKEPIGVTVSTLTKFFMNALSLMSKNKLTHYSLKIANRLVESAETALFLETTNENCINCENDRLQLMTIIDFIVNKYETILEEKTKNNIVNAFQTHFKRSLESINEQVDSYVETNVYSE